MRQKAEKEDSDGQSYGDQELPFEIAHVLFMDIVGYSKLLINEQRALRETLNQIVRGTDQFRTADSAGTLIKSPTGDGMALIFRGSPEQPVECALEVSRALKAQPNLPLRMGVHSGPVSGVIDVNDQTSVAGAGINIAQRVMDCGDAGHILLSKRAAEDLAQYSRWHSQLHDLGECEVKHGVIVYVVNLYTNEIGNPHLPKSLKQRRQDQAAANAADSGATIRRKQAIAVIAFLLFLIAAVVWIVQAQRRQTGIIQKQSEQVTTIVDRYQKMEEALVRLANAEAQSKQPGSKISPEEQRASAYTTLERELALPIGTLAKELPGFALQLYNRSDTTPLMRARAAYALGRLDEAEKLSLETATEDRQAYETAQNVSEDRRKRAIEDYVLAGQAAQKRIQYGDATQHFHEAEKLTDRERSPGDWAEVQYATANLLFDEGQYNGAENILRRVVEIRSHVLGSENPETLRSRNRLDHALWRQAKNRVAEEDFRELVKLDEKVLGPEHPDTLSSRNGLTNVLVSQGKYAEAESEYRLILKLREKVLGPEHPDTLRSRFNLAVTLGTQGKHIEAERQFRELGKIQEKVLGPEHPDTLFSRVGLAAALSNQGNPGKRAEAEAQYRELIKIQGKVLGPEHPDTLFSRVGLAATLNDQGRYVEAEAQYRELIKIQGKVLGPEHPDTLSCCANLANVLDEQGKYVQAEAQYREVIKILGKVLGPEHPDTLRSRGGLAAALNDQGKYVEAEAEYRDIIKIQEKILGPEHPDTLKSRNGLATALNDQRKYADAETNFRELIKIQEKVLDPEHPDTLDSYYSFACGLKGQNKLQEANEFARRAGEGARKVLGPDHPLTQKYEKLLADLEANN